MSLVGTRSLDQTARWFHALSDETRLRIIDCLAECEQCVCDLTEVLQTGQSRLSFHLKTLKDAGILNDRREGRWIYYSLNRETLEQIADLLASFNKRRTPGRSQTRSCCE
jgi:ArsR family transcriptional regulator